MRTPVALLALILLASPILASAQSDALPSPASVMTPEMISRARQQGADAARSVGTWRWFSIGFAGGVIAIPVGALATIGVAAGYKVDVPPETRLTGAERDSGYWTQFDKGYRGKVRAKRTVSALLGAVTGIVAVVATLLALLAHSDL